MDVHELGEEIVRDVGGESNINNLTHCATRLRFELKDDSLVDLDKLKSLDGVLTAQIQGGQTQVVIGAKVTTVFDDIMDNIHISGGGEPAQPEKKEKKNPLNEMVSALSGIFAPTLPVLIGCGMFKALVSMVTTLGILPETNSLVVMMTIIGDLIFYFFPFFLAVSAARRFNTQEYMAIALAAALMYPTIMDGAVAASAGGPATMSFLGMPILFVNYKSTVLPIILSVWVLSLLYKRIDKLVPDMLKVFLTPMLVLIIMVPLELIVLGPIGSYAGEYIAQFISWFYEVGGVFAAALLGALRAPLTMLGMHYALSPLQIQQIAATGTTTLLVSALANNFAQSGAAFGTALAIKDKGKRGASLGAALSAFMGITEPAMYGVNLVYKRPFGFAMVSAAIASAFFQMFHTVGLAYVPPGIFTIVSFQADSFIFVILGVILAFSVAAVLSFFFGVPKEMNVVGSGDAVADSGQDNGEAVIAKEHLPEDITAPVKGSVIPMTDVKDEVFSSEAMGTGVAIIPKEGKVYAPCDGTVAMVFPTGHAIGLVSNEGVELLVHIGLNTVEENGNGFTIKAEAEQKVKKGDLLVEFDLDMLGKKYDMTTPVIVSNTPNFTDIQKFTGIEADNNTVILRVE